MAVDMDLKNVSKTFRYFSITTNKYLNFLQRVCYKINHKISFSINN